MKSLYGKLIFGFLVSIILSFSFAGYFGLKNNSEKIEQLTLLRLQSIAKAVQDEASNHDFQTLNNLANASSVGIVLVSNSDGQIDAFGDKMTPEEIQSFDNAPVGKDYCRSGTSVIYRVALPNDYTAYIKKNVIQEELLFQQSAMLALGGIFITGSLIFLIIADVIVKPIKRLTSATNALAQGNYDVQVNYYGKDELAALSAGFNSMAKRLVKVEENRQKFISDISHEFQTPLTSIQGFAKILTAEQVNDEQRRRYANIILEQSQRLSTLSKNMMQLTVLEGDDLKLEKKKYSLIKQLERIVEMQQGFASDQQVDIETDFPKGDIQITADEDRMEQVFINLLNNALKYTLEDGVVTIRVKRNLKDVEIQFEDTGIGMNKEALSHIFNRFYRVDKSRSIKGNGLGLSIVKRIIDLHGYKLNVESQEEVGSVFKITIPLENGRFINKNKFEGI